MVDRGERMSQEKRKFNLSKLKDISSIDFKDIGKIFKKIKNIPASSDHRYGFRKRFQPPRGWLLRHPHTFFQFPESDCCVPLLS